MRELPPTAGLPLTASDLFRVPKQSFTLGVAQWLGIPEPILTCSGTAALVVILETMKRREPLRKSVILPADTCPLVALAVSLADIPLHRPDTFRLWIAANALVACRIFLLWAGSEPLDAQKGCVAWALMFLEIVAMKKAFGLF